MSLTPGIAFILYQIYRLALPSVIFGYALKVLSNRGVFGGNILPTWAAVLGSLFFLPIITAIRIIIKDFDDRRQAAKLGARLARRIDGKAIGNIDLLATLRRLWDTGYIADGFINHVGEGDPVVNLRILWSDMIFTVWPEHIKTILATDFPNYEKGKRFQYSMSSVLGSGVFNSDGDMWNLNAGIPYPHNATYVPPNSAIPQAKRANEFATAFAQAQEVISSRERYGWIWPLTEIFEDKTKKPMKIVRAYLDPIIQDAIAKNNAAPKNESKEKSESHVEEGETLIDHLINITSGE
ncbi:hypothetical protein C0993_001749 [Termitomyces sp. T159_Od127]|nr:hypothetical protein C0993_001749 [Termitomyces sp. T159_Od127]